MLINQHLFAPMRKSSPFAPVLRTRIIRALPLLRLHCRIYVVKTQTCLQALSLRNAFSTVHTFPVITQKLYLETHIPQILLTSECRCWVSLM